MTTHPVSRSRTRPFTAIILAVLCTAFLAGPAAVADVTLKQLPRAPVRPTTPQLSPEVQKDVIGQQKLFDGGILRLMTAWPGPPYVKGVQMKIHVVISGTCPKLFVDWGDGSLGTYTNKSTWQFPHTYQKAGIMGVRVWGEGCLGEAKGQYVIHQSAPTNAMPAIPGFSSCPNAGITRVMGKFGVVMNELSKSSDNVLLTGCGFGTQPGKVELLGRQLGSGLSLAYPFPKRLGAKVLEWTPNSIYVQIPLPQVLVADQTIDILVSPSESLTPLPRYGILWRAQRATHELSSDEVKIHCGLESSDCPHLPAATFSATHGCVPKGTVTKSFDTVKIGPLANGWVTKRVSYWFAGPRNGAIAGYSGFQPGQAEATIRVDYTLPYEEEGEACYTLAYTMNVEIEGPAGIPYQYKSASVKGTLLPPLAP